MSDFPDYDGYKVQFVASHEVIPSGQKQSLLALVLKPGSVLLLRLFLWRYSYLFDLLAERQNRKCL